MSEEGINLLKPKAHKTEFTKNKKLKKTSLQTMKLALFSLATIAAAFRPGHVAAQTTTDFKFGAHAVDQCSDPVATVTNSDVLNVFPTRDDDGVCRDERGICFGDCVTVVIDAGSKGQSPPINVRVGLGLQDPGNCSPIAEKENSPKGWDFTWNGKCGKGNSGVGFWQNCFVHDICVWARCTDDDAVPGGISIDAFGVTGGQDDEFCGKAYLDAKEDWRKANAPIIGCATDAACPDPMTCRVGKCIFPRPDGDYCDDDDDCEGYCSFLRCRSGREGDFCDKDSDCDGYCEMFKCYDGSEGDRCGKDSDCQSGLTCFGTAGSARCSKKKGEGAQCGHDNDCLGYCQMLRCWDGSRGDKCKRGSDCKSGKCRFRRCK